MSQSFKDFAPVSGPFIDGRDVLSDSDERLGIVNPSTGRRISDLPAGSALDADRAVRSAQSVFENGCWSEMPLLARKAVLAKLADLISREARDLDAVDAREMGKPVSETFASAAESATLMRFFGESVDKVTGDSYRCDRGSMVAQRLLPRGVVAAIAPWNFPSFNAVLKVAPALAAGNSVVLKPSELSPTSAFRLASLALEAGLPPGVLNVVPGRGEVVGKALALHSSVDMITFTGSTEVGKLILQYSGQSNMKGVLTECGGKSPHIVFEDCPDIEAAAGSIGEGLLHNQGQICSVGSRLLVAQSIEKRMLDRISARVRDVNIGNASDPGTTFGPLASSSQWSKVMSYLEGAAAEGAELVAGGHEVLQEMGGFFVEPTVFRDVRPDSAIGQEEIFGPVLGVTTFRSEEEAVRLANSTVYGLAGYVWTGDLSRAMRLSSRVRGSVTINGAVPSGDGAGHAASWEPAGQSGIGSEGGLAGLAAYMRRQLVWFNYLQ